MLATQMPDTPPEAKDVKQIKEKLAQSLKALQKRYVTSDAVVTSEDGDANLLCCALEAIFIHGIKSKYVRTEAGGRSRKGDRGPLPQPFFWSLLKTVTHRDVVTELEKISFVSTDVGRCRAWLRLALNHGLLECYLASLFREGSKLRAHYQPSALLLNTEEREVLLSYLQGLASLTFSLSYKSAVLNEWTTTPLALSGLCPLSQVETVDLPLNGQGDLPTSKSTYKESWDTVSQSSGSSDAPDLQSGCPVLLGRGTSALQGGRTGLNSSNLSLDTTGSSQLSSSLSSDSLLQGQDPRSPAGEQWSSCDLDMPINVTVSTKRPQKDSQAEFRESGHCSQDSMREDSFVSSTGPDQYSETAIFSGSDSEIQGPPTPSQDHVDALPDSVLSDSEPPPTSDENHVDGSPSEASSELHPDTDAVPSAVGEPLEPPEPLEEVNTADVQESPEPVKEEKEPEVSEPSVHQSARRSTSILSRKLSSDSLSHSRSWISEDDIYKPHLEEVSDHDEAPPAATTAELKVSQSPPSVVHRRQIGLSNPFRGLLKLGHLERRGAMGMWRDNYCELSPFEFRLYLNAEERTCSENCSLLRCEEARIASPEGRFELAFPGKRLYLRADNRGEAEDWVDRIIEAVNKCRPASRNDDQWEVLQPTSENGVDASSPSSAPSSPERGSLSSDTGTCAGQEAPPPPQELDWTRAADLETDAIKESVLYFSTDPEARTWAPLVFSLSLEALKGFRVHEGRKLPRLTHLIEEIRDVVPDVSQGGPAFFRLLTVRETIKLRAENAEEARSWRVLIRGALDSYLESGEDGGSAEPAVVSGRGVSGNLHRLVQHRLKENGALLVNLCTVPSEKGLDAQSFKCAGCPQQIGPSRGRARLCEFSGQYYCDSCHHGDTTIIPSRMVHNWDLTQREVCKKALHLLAQVEQEPLLNLEQLNPDLVRHSESMAQAHNLRQRLRLLGDYLLTCRSGACKKLHARMEQRTYLLESSHLYSVLDLRQIAEGEYSNYLLTLLQHASNHVFHCDLCTQRGFICQTCHANDIIFPFQFDITTRCRDCKAVFHLACRAAGDACPRCQRMKRYLERDLQY
ncbi:pleckstrin homology domain-containing family M member 1 isoform X2 [Centropristis striata]|uniref:pleckstrin homology domain-containing family M member 1 isoform X2 n=1 Tax=Centropristis striata TaxID=184440 RepID=UPI0027DEC2DF|nr:pleckstrin homology domain-containing family M member 1 isoform X2 [Centropristis striata]